MKNQEPEDLAAWVIGMIFGIILFLIMFNS